MRIKVLENKKHIKALIDKHMIDFIRKAFFKFRQVYLYKIVGNCKIACYNALGANISYTVRLNKITILWPHQVVIGAYTKVEDNVEIKIDGQYKQGKSVIIGQSVYIGRGVEFNIIDGLHIENNALLASGVKCIDHDHGIDLGKKIGKHPGKSAPIVLKDNCWIGANAIILKGVIVGEGAVVAAGSIVLQSIPSYEIWGGIPAKKIGKRT